MASVETANAVLCEMREWAQDKASDGGAMLESTRVGNRLLGWIERLEGAVRQYSDVNARQDMENARMRRAVLDVISPILNLDLERMTGQEFPIDAYDPSWYVCRNYDTGFGERNAVKPKEGIAMLSALNCLYEAVKRANAHRWALGLTETGDSDATEKGA